MPDTPYTSDELEAMFVTANMLIQCQDRIGERIPKDYHKLDSNLALLHATECRLMEIICGNMSEEELDAMQERYLGCGGSDDVPDENHPGARRVQ